MSINLPPRMVWAFCPNVSVEPSVKSMVAETLFELVCPNNAIGKNNDRNTAKNVSACVFIFNDMGRTGKSPSVGFL